MPPSSSSSSAFDTLHPLVQQWVWNEGWTNLHAAQELAIPLILRADRDVLISASTASGKTEAAFLPILSRLMDLPPADQLVLLISPLKALINDQFDRLESLCETLGVPVTAWHGDIAASRKQQFRKNPRGVLLITPESLEAMFVNQGSQLPRIFSNLQFTIIDELHCYIGEERGRQLQSLLHRIELAIGRKVPRIGLSATLGDMNLAAQYMRSDRPVEIIECPSSGATLLLSLKVYYAPTLVESPGGSINIDNNLGPLENVEVCDADLPNDAIEPETINDIARHIYKNTKDSKNLIFPNSRQKVEYYADVLRSLCEADGRPNAYWPHHGNLATALREEVEGYLKNSSQPANAVCTSTMEMGVDFGSVTSIAQVGNPPSVASLRQRLGRSGRKRGESPILRAYCMCKGINPESKPMERLHADLIQTIATIQLLTRGWYEPPKPSHLHLSTLVHQVLSSIAQHSSRTAVALWTDLIATGPHRGLSKLEFKGLLVELGKHDLIMQDADGSFLLGMLGERFTKNYEFYTVFPLCEEYRIECSGRTIGTITKEAMLSPGQKIIFAGRRWSIISIMQDENIIEVERARGGQALSFGGSAVARHDMVIAEMRSVLESSAEYSYSDQTARGALGDARNFYRNAGLSKNYFFEVGNDIILLTWTGDVVTQTLAYVLSSLTIEVSVGGYYLILNSISVEEVIIVLERLISIENPDDIFDEIVPPKFNRWDWALPESLLKKDFLSRACNLDGALQLVTRLLESRKHNESGVS